MDIKWNDHHFLDSWYKVPCAFLVLETVELIREGETLLVKRITQKKWQQTTVADPCLHIKGARSPKKLFLPFAPQFGLK